MTTEVTGAGTEESRPVVVRRWWPRAGARPTGPAPRPTLPPHRQVQLLWLLTVLVVVAVVVTGPWALRNARDGVRLATSRLVPASTALATATRNYAAGTAELVTVAESSDGQARSVGLPRLTAYDTAANGAWRTYEAHSAQLPGEAKLQKQAAALTQQLSDTGVTLLTSTQTQPAALATFTALADNQQQVLASLQRLYASRINAVVTSTNRSFDTRQRDLVIIATTVLVLTMIAFGMVTISIRRRYRTQLDEARRNDLESGLQRALEMARTEPECCTLVQRAIGNNEPDLPSELLLADSSRAHFRQVITTDPTGGPGCPVMSPNDCPATNRGQTQVWPTSGAIDACPHLQHRESGPCSAVCVPVGIAGKTVGVMHATRPDNDPPDESTIADLELIARKTGERIGILRAFNRSETQARTDPLTGLLNRRSLEAAVRDLTAEDHQYAVAYGDLDHFKLLNDVHGHDTGDRALRLFARVLRDSVRPNDIAARYGGEEFVVVLPDCTTTDAYAVIDRVRARLARAQDGGTVPAFTVSFGLAPAEPHLAFGEIVEQADAALLEAKTAGRDRVVVAREPDPPDAAAKPTSKAGVRPLP